MASTLTPGTTVTPSPLSLHSEGTPREVAMPSTASAWNDDQLTLAPTITAVHRANGNRIRALLNKAIALNGISHSDLAAETGVDEKQLGRALRDDGGAHPPLALVAAIFARDHVGVLVHGLCALVGYEARRKTPDLAADNKRLRSELAAVREQINRLLDEP